MCSIRNVDLINYYLYYVITKFMEQTELYSKYIFYLHIYNYYFYEWVPRMGFSVPFVPSPFGQIGQCTSSCHTCNWTLYNLVGLCYFVHILSWTDPECF